MTDGSDAVPVGEDASETCISCKRPGALCCVKLEPRASGPDKPLYAHPDCAAQEGWPIRYRLIPPADTCAVCREPGATTPEPLFLGDAHIRYVHPGCAAAEASASGGGQ